jgi:hypothetical protein
MTLRVFKTRTFARWSKRVGLSDAMLWKSVDEMRDGLLDADLGGHVVKKRIALPGRGKRGGVRTLVATRLAKRWFFLYGFSKNERSDISGNALRGFQELAKELLGFDESELAIAVAAGELLELKREQDKSEESDVRGDP